MIYAALSLSIPAVFPFCRGFLEPYVCLLTCHPQSCCTKMGLLVFQCLSLSVLEVIVVTSYTIRDLRMATS